MEAAGVSLAFMCAPWWRLLNSPLIVMLIGALLAACFAFVYQRHLKKFEMRWDIYKGMASNASECLLQARRVQLLSHSKKDQSEVQQEKLRDLTAAGGAITARLATLFSEKVSEPWATSVNCFHNCSIDPSPRDFDALYDMAAAKAEEAILAASKEIRMPFKIPRKGKGRKAR